MNEVTIIQGDLLEAEVQYIVHQCNCRTKTAAGLAAAIFKKYPEANVYINRLKESTPGTIEIKGKVIALYGQYHPGKIKWNSEKDSVALRKLWFHEGLTEILEIPNIKSVAFPYNIGCGLAGGNWTEYNKMIDDFANKHPSIKVAIYKID